MASKFCESSHSGRRGLPTPSHLHLAKSGQGLFKRQTGDVCLVIRSKGDAMGRATTRAKAQIVIASVSPGLKTRSPGLKSGAGTILTCCRHGAANVETPGPGPQSGETGEVCL